MTNATSIEMGLAIFYILGALVIIAIALVVLVAKKESARNLSVFSFLLHIYKKPETQV